MKYAIRVTTTCPEGAVDSRTVWLAETEDEMKAMLEACRLKLSYIGAECIGPIEEPSPFLKDKIAECMPNNVLTVSGGREKTNA